MQPEAALALLANAAVAAGDAAMHYFRSGRPTTAKVSYKAGDSPVSEADFAANAALEKALRDRFPAFGWVSEETPAGDGVAAGAPVLIVDPIDGTRAFIAGDPQWSVSVALVIGARPVAGVVHAPALGVTFTARNGGGAFAHGRKVTCSRRSELAGGLVAGPRPLLDRLEAAVGDVRRAPRTPSLALRLAGCADGAFDAAVASQGAHDWDVAAADVILAEAGGVLIGESGTSLRYSAVARRHGLLVAGPPTLAGQALAKVGLRS